MFTAHRVRNIRVRDRLRALIGSCALLLLVPWPADAQDICRLSGPDLQKEVEAGTAEIAEAYARTAGQLELKGSPKVQRACNWTCSNPANLGFLKHVFAFLQYNCNTTTVPGTRLPTGPRTASQMGLSITDASYRDAADKIFRSGSTGAGDLMRVPPSVEAAAKSGDVKKLTDAVDALPGASWLKFSSTSVNNPPDGAARVLIRVVDAKRPPRFEQWIQIAIDADTGKLGRNVDFIAVQLRSDRAPSEELTPPVVVFRGFSRTPTGFVPEGAGPGGGELTKCYSCHPNGLRTVVPAPDGSVAAGGSKAVRPDGTIPTTGPGNITEITNENAKKRSELGPRGYTASENGPIFGPEEGLDREALVANGLPARPGRAPVPPCGASVKEPARRTAIVTNMNCAQCHDGSTDRGFLNAGTNLGTIKHKVVDNDAAPMPPPEMWRKNPSLKLSPPERKVLFECLRAEYAELLHIWLTPSP
jgi:hypothetical protein